MSHAKIFIASDHAGFLLKEFLAGEFGFTDLGPETDARCDYPDYAKKGALLLQKGKFQKGILVCGSGIGMSMAANRFSGVRAVIAESERAARLSRLHNDSNILCLGGRTLAPDHAADIVNAWLETKFEKGRHLIRIQKMEKK